MRIEESYNRVAGEYAARMADEMANKPLDRELLARLADDVRPLAALVCDLGCGPGQAAALLHEAGCQVIGIDLSPGMVAEASRLHPAISFRVGDMTALDVADASWAGIAALYSIVHLTEATLPVALAEMYRCLLPDGILLLAFHTGNEVRHVDEWLDAEVDLDFRFFDPAGIVQLLWDAGFERIEVLEREPYPDVELPTRRAYVFARKPVDLAG